MRMIPITALLLLSLICAGTATGTATGDEVTDIAGAVAAAGHDVPAPDVLRRACDRDTLCVARFLKDRVGEGAAILPDIPAVENPRGWRRQPALHQTILDADKRLIIVPARFDDAVAQAISKADNDGTIITKVVLDLRRLESSADLDAMRRLAAWFSGKHDRAFRQNHNGGRIVDWNIPKPARKLGVKALEIWIDGNSDATVEVFAALMRKYVGARVLGEAPRAHGQILQAIPVMHGWKLMVPTGRLSVPGEDLAGGMMPDGPLPE